MENNKEIAEETVRVIKAIQRALGNSSFTVASSALINMLSTVIIAQVCSVVEKSPDKDPDEGAECLMNDMISTLKKSVNLNMLGAMERLAKRQKENRNGE